MIWISEFFFCVGTMSLVGSIAYIIFLIFRKMMAKSKRGLILNAIKTIITLHLIPVVYIVLRVSKMVFRGGTWMNIGDFGANLSPDVVKLVNITVRVWLVGLAIGVLIRAVEYFGLRRTMVFNIPGLDERWDELAAAECEKYHLKNVRIFQNEQLRTAITVGVFRPTIVFPLLVYPEKMMHMIVEHEVSHVRSHDLVWKQLALWASWLHWFNPLVYLLMKELRVEQEIECDMFICENTSHYTVKEYLEFLLLVGEGRTRFTSSAALFESKKDVVRRIEAMSERRRLGRASKTLLLVCSLALVFAASIPTYAMAEKVAGAEERVLYNTEAMNEDAAVGTEHILDEEPLNEVFIDIDTYALGSMITINFTAEPYTRYYFKSQSMEVGDQVGVNIQCNDSDATYWVGIKEIYTNSGRYVQGTGTVTHTFTITEEGTYRVFLENRSDEAVDFLGAATYPN